MNKRILLALSCVLLAGITLLTIASTYTSSDSAHRFNGTIYATDSSLAGTASMGSASITNTLTMPTTTGSTSGVLYKGAVPWMHDYSVAGSDRQNVFLGGAGNFTLNWDGANAYTASRNLGIGPGALTNLTTGYFNYGMGYNANNKITTGAGNTAIGGNANPACTTGFDNIAIGDDALFANVSSSVNTAVGHYAGATLVSAPVYGSTYGRNSFFGYNADCAAGVAATLTNSSAIGANATVTKDNQMVFGNGITENLFAGNLVSGGTIFANGAPNCIKYYSDGTTAHDGLIGTVADGTLLLSNIDQNRGLKIMPSGEVQSYPLSTINGYYGGANFRARADGTGPNDGLFAASGGTIYFANWDLTRGMKILSGGIVATYGSFGSVLSVGSTTYIDASKRSQTNQVAGAMTFSYCTNGVDAIDTTVVRWLFNSSGSDQTLTFPIINTGVNGWRTNVYSAVPPAITNGTIMKIILDVGGPTDTLARQTNCYVKFEYYQ